MKKIKVVAFDLETIPNQDSIRFLPKVKPAGNLKDPAKIEADIAAKKKKQVEEMNLDPRFNKICVAGWATDEGAFSIAIDEETEDEKSLLINFWESMKDYDHFVTFNGRSFDMPCLLLHGMKHGVRPSVFIDFWLYNNNGNHTDLRQILAGSDKFAKGKLDTFAQIFLDDHKSEGIDGAMVADWWEIGAVDKIREYCEHDCNLTLRLFNMAVDAGLIRGF